MSTVRVIGRSRRRRVVTLLTAAVMLVGIQQAPGSQASGHRPFAPDSAWNTPIPAAPALDPLSGLMVASLRGGSHVANTREFGIPIWHADASTPRYRVTCTMRLLWGPCGLESDPDRVPIPRGATPSPGSDRAMVVVDHSTGKSYEFWHYSWNLGWPTAGFGGVVHLDGPGTPGQAVGAGVSRLAGVVRGFELVQGRIDHALVFSSDNACRIGHRYPASKTDGTSMRVDCIPQGARVQLDPSIDLDSLGLNRGERMVAEALQRYGAYNVDNGGARMAFAFETRDLTFYTLHASFDHDYWDMKNIPWHKLRVLQRWDGAAGT